MKIVTIARHALSSLLLSALFAFLLMPAYAGTDQGGPVETVKTFDATLLEAMKNADQLGYEGRYKLLDPVISNSFALPFMLRQATGRYWKKLSGKQKKELLEVYTKWSIATYAARFNGYSGERFEVVPQASQARSTASVVSKLIKSNGQEIEFDYQLQKREGSWKVVDILIKGVSQLAMTRAQFVDLLDKNGYDGLLSSLKKKIAEFSKKKE